MLGEAKLWPCCLLCTLTLDLLEGEKLIRACSTVLHLALANKVLGGILMDAALEALVQRGCPFQSRILILCSYVPISSQVLRTCERQSAEEAAAED